MDFRDPRNEQIGTLNFLALLRSYPLLYNPSAFPNNKETRTERANECALILKDCQRERVNIYDKEALYAAIDRLRRHFDANLARYKENIENGNLKWKPKCYWFHHAEFMDNTGFLEGLAKKKKLKKKKKVIQMPRPIPLDVPRAQGVKEVVSSDDTPKVEEIETQWAVKRSRLNCNLTASQVNDLENERSVEHENNSDLEEGPDYLDAYLDYVKIRTKGYRPNQKRHFVNVLDHVMNIVEQPRRENDDSPD